MKDMMKKLFSFKSHSSLNNNQPSPTSTDKQEPLEKKLNKVDMCAETKNGSEDHTFGSSPSQKGSLYLSSGSLYDSISHSEARSQSFRESSGMKLLLSSSNGDDYGKLVKHVVDAERLSQSCRFWHKMMPTEIEHDGSIMVEDVHAKASTDDLSPRTYKMNGLDAQCRRLEKEKNELQLAYENELQGRSAAWSLMLEKSQAEEQRLGGRIQELAEQNVCLQRGLSSYTTTVDQVRDLSVLLQEASEKNFFLENSLYELESRAKEVEEDRDSILRNFVAYKLQRIEKDEIISQIQDDLQEHEKEVAKVTGQRDQMLEEVKKLTEENKLLRLEITRLKKEIKTMDENMLLMDGQIRSYRFF